MIELKHVSKTFYKKDAAVSALTDVSLQIAEGEVFGVIGSSGAGKSTLIRCINLLERPTTGDVIVGGENLVSLSSRQLTRTRRRIQLLNASNNQALLGATPVVAVTTTGSLVSLSRTWETVKNKNIGIDFAVLQNHLSGTFDYYWKENANMLLGQTYPGGLGASAPPLNIGDLKTWGWEGVLTWRDNIGKDFSYTVSVNMSNNQNKLVHYGGANVVGTGYNATVEGYPLGSYFGLRYGGRIQNQKQLDAYNAAYAPTGSTNNVGLPIPTVLASPAGQLSGLRPGDNMFKDVNGDGKLSIGTSSKNLGDLVYLGRDDPNYSFGFNLGAQMEGDRLSGHFPGSFKKDDLQKQQLANTLWNDLPGPE